MCVTCASQADVRLSDVEALFSSAFEEEYAAAGESKGKVWVHPVIQVLTQGRLRTSPTPLPISHRSPTDPLHSSPVQYTGPAKPSHLGVHLGVPSSPPHPIPHSFYSLPPPLPLPLPSPQALIRAEGVRKSTDDSLFRSCVDVKQSAREALEELAAGLRRVATAQVASAQEAGMEAAITEEEEATQEALMGAAETHAEEQRAEEAVAAADVAHEHAEQTTNENGRRA